MTARASDRLELDVVIFGGGAAGLWLLDEVIGRGYRALLLEARQLGQGQTAAAQGIVHGGLKYVLGGLLGAETRALHEMPRTFRECLAGRRRPNLQRTRLRAVHCHLWSTDHLGAQLGILAARACLEVRPVRLPTTERPPALAACPGEVLRLDEQVIDPVSLVDDLAAQHAGHILLVNASEGVDFDLASSGEVRAIRITPPRPSAAPPIELRPAAVVLTAGAGNSALRARVGLSPTVMQRRPLHMTLARGDLPELYGHCIDGAGVRMTITSALDAEGRRVWQLGGRLAEEGARLDAPALLDHARAELAAVLPGIEPARLGWSTYRIDRAEAATPEGRRPEDAWCVREGTVITGWPTKLALVPRLALGILALLPAPAPADALDVAALGSWPRPTTAPAPWETVSWCCDR